MAGKQRHVNPQSTVPGDYWATAGTVKRPKRLPLGYWTKDRVVSWILSLYIADGWNGLQVKSISNSFPGGSLRIMGRQLFGSFPAAIRAAGLSTSERDSYIRTQKSLLQKGIGPQGLLTVLREMHSFGHPLVSTYTPPSSSRLRAAARSFFNGWKKAVQAAGINYEEVHKIYKELGNLYVSHSPQGNQLTTRTVAALCRPASRTRIEAVFPSLGHAVAASIPQIMEDIRENRAPYLWKFPEKDAILIFTLDILKILEQKYVAESKDYFMVNKRLAESCESILWNNYFPKLAAKEDYEHADAVAKIVDNVRQVLYERSFGKWLPLPN